MAEPRTWTAEEFHALGVRTDLVTAASVLGIGRTKAHELARAGEFPVPVLKLGSRYAVPTAPLAAFLFIPQDRVYTERSGGELEESA